MATMLCVDHMFSGVEGETFPSGARPTSTPTFPMISHPSHDGRCLACRSYGSTACAERKTAILIFRRNAWLALQHRAGVGEERGSRSSSLGYELDPVMSKGVRSGFHKVSILYLLCLTQFCQYFLLSLSSSHPACLSFKQKTSSM
jgi:hypothetical protein